MCSHYEPVIQKQQLAKHFKVEAIDPSLKAELWPGYIGPFIRKHEYADVGDDAVPFRELMVGSFGLIPHWSKDTKIARMTYNARSETVAEKNSYRDAWRLSRRCIIPAEAIYEPNWQSGKAVNTRIVRTDGKPMGIAGIWTGWRDLESKEILRSFSMLTVNADDHEFMRNFHRPEDEKRMVVILQEEDYDAWLSASPTECRHLLGQYPAEQMTVEAKP